MDFKNKYLKYKKKYLQLKKLIGGAKPLKPIPKDKEHGDWKIHWVSKYRTSHLGNGYHYTSDIIKEDTCMGYTFYETSNSIYYHSGISRANLECNCKRNHLDFLK